MAGDRRYLPLSGLGLGMFVKPSNLQRGRVRIASGFEIIEPGLGIPQAIYTQPVDADAITDVYYAVHIANSAYDASVSFLTTYQYHEDEEEPDDNDVGWTDQTDPFIPSAQGGAPAPVRINRAYFLSDQLWIRLKIVVSTYPYGFSSRLFWHFHANMRHYQRLNNKRRSLVAYRGILDYQEDWREE